MSVDFFLARTNSDFKIGEKYRKYVINDAWKSNDALWELMDGMAGEAASKLNERITNLTKGVSDVDLCDVKSLDSMSYQLGLGATFGFINSLPSEVYDLMNVLSVKQNNFLKKNMVFTQAGLDTIMDSIPEALEALAGSPSASILDAVLFSLSSVLASLVADGSLSQPVSDEIFSRISLSSSLADGLYSCVFLGHLDEALSTSIKRKVINSLITSGKISYDDYKSTAVQGSGYQDTSDVNVLSALEFSDVIKDGEYVRQYSVSDSIRNANSSDLNALSDALTSRFSTSIWNITTVKFLEILNLIPTLSLSSKSWLTVAVMTLDVPNALYASIDGEHILKSEFTSILGAINSTTFFEVLEDLGVNRYDISDEAGLASFVSEFVGSGAIEAGDSGSFSSSVEEDGLIPTIRNWIKIGRFNSAVLINSSPAWLRATISYLGTYYSLQRFGYFDTNIEVNFGPDPDIDLDINSKMMYYGFIPASVAGNITSVSELTQEMFMDPNSSIVASLTGNLEKYNVGEVPAGSWLVALLPHGPTYEARKYNGVTGYCEFNEDVAHPGTGSNGNHTILINDELYDIYGEFQMVTAESSIYVIKLLSGYNGIKLENNSDSVIVFVGSEWLVFRNLWERYPSMSMLANPGTVAAGNVARYTIESSSLQLPVGNDGDVVGVQVRMAQAPLYVGVQVYLNSVVYNAYYSLIMEKLSCVLNAGNAEDMSIYEYDFLEYTDRSGYSQLVNDRNVNHDFLRALVFSNFCSNFYKDSALRGDWFLDSTIHYNGSDAIDAPTVVSAIARSLTDMTLAVTIRRETIKRLAIQYSFIGSNYGLEKVVGNYVLRNYTKRENDFNFSSSVANENDDALPSISDIGNRFSVSLTEYFDMTDYLNISAQSAMAKERTIFESIKPCASINNLGQLVTGYSITNTAVYTDSNLPQITGGNDRFWESEDYKTRVQNLGDDIVMFYRNVDGAMDNLGSLASIVSVFSKMWENCAVSSLVNENLEMHKKYIGDGSGYMTAVNSGNPNYPTIAPLPTLANLSEVLGSSGRDYQSVVNDDRPDIVEGVAPKIICAYSFAPLVGDEWSNDNIRRDGMPPYFTFPSASYISDFTRTESIARTEFQTRMEVQETILSAMTTGYVSSMIYEPSTIVEYQQINPEVRGTLITGFDVLGGVASCYVDYYRYLVTSLDISVTPNVVVSSLVESYVKPFLTDDDFEQGRYLEGVPPYYVEPLSAYRATKFSVCSQVVYDPQWLDKEGDLINGGNAIAIGNYTLSGRLSEPAPDMYLENAFLSYIDAIADVLDQDTSVATMESIWNAYAEDEDLTGNISALSSVSATFGAVQDSIAFIDAPWYEDNLVNKKMLSSYYQFPAVGTVQFTYEPSDVCIEVYDDDYTYEYGGETITGGVMPLSTYGDVTSEMTNIIGKISASLEVSELNALSSYINSVIAGKITIDNAYSDLPNDTGSDLIRIIFRRLRECGYNYDYMARISAVRSSFDDAFPIVTASSTLDNWNKYKDAIDAEILEAASLNAELELYDADSDFSVEVNRAISSYNYSEIDDIFDTKIADAMDFVNNRIIIDSVSSVSSWLLSEPVLASFPVSSEVLTQRVVEDFNAPMVSTWVETEQVEKIIEHRVVADVEVPYSLTGYKIVDSSEIAAEYRGTIDMFDAYGGLINSWRNANVELKGYQTCYEASPNLDDSYTEIRYADVDGPWIGDALYDLIASIVPLSSHIDSQVLLTPEPEPEKLSVAALKLAHQYNSDGVKDGKWWMPKYVEALKGHDLEHQLPFYLSDILDCRTKSVFEIEADSFGNSYTLLKDRNEENPYDAEGVLWMRHHNFPFSFPIVQPPVSGWDDASAEQVVSLTNKVGTYLRAADLDGVSGFAWTSQGASPSAVFTAAEYPEKYTETVWMEDEEEISSPIMDYNFAAPEQTLGRKIDQIFIGYAQNTWRTIFNRCLAFGVNNTSVWVAGFDGKNLDGSDHFNLKILQCKYFEFGGIKYYGNRNPRAADKFNSDPTGYDSENLLVNSASDEYRWTDFCGGYYDSNVINFVFWGEAGFRFRLYNLTTTRLNNADIIAKFTDAETATTYAPNIVDGHNPFRLVEDNNHCYVGWISGDKLVICRMDKDDYRFEGLLTWEIPQSELSRELNSLVAGPETIKVQFKPSQGELHGNVYYAALSEHDFGGNTGVGTLIPIDSIGLDYIASELEEGLDEAQCAKLPRIPIRGITQWRQWGYSLTDPSLYAISYADAMCVSAIASFEVGLSGQHYNMQTKRLYVPGNRIEREVISYEADSGVLESDGQTILTGYDIGERFGEITPYLQTVISTYAPSSMVVPFTPVEGFLETVSSFYEEPMTLSAYYGLPYNNLYVERTDLGDNLESMLLSENPTVKYNMLTLKNFYNYSYEHEYSWNNAMQVTDPEMAMKILGWRKYLKCSISRYSDAMWMSYQYLRDYTVLPQLNKQQQVAFILNDFEFVDMIYGTIHLMNNSYNKSPVYSISINDSELNRRLYENDTPELQLKRENARRQIEEDVREMALKFAPIHTQLWKIDFNG